MSVTTPPPPPLSTNDELAVPRQYFDQVYAGVGRGGGGKGRMEGGDRVGGNLAPWPLGGDRRPWFMQSASVRTHPALYITSITDRVRIR